MVIRAATLLSASGPGGEYTEQVRPLGVDSPRCVIVAPGSGSDGSSYVVERAPNAGSSTPGGDPALAARAATYDGWCLTAAGFGAGEITGSYDPAAAADKLATLATTLTDPDSPWGGCTGPVIGVGISMGFLTLTATLIRHPQLLAGVIGIVPLISATHIWTEIYSVPVPAGVVPYDPETHTAAFDGIPTTILSMRGDVTVDDDDESHALAFCAATGATRWRIGSGTHGTWALTGSILRAALNTM